MFNEFSLGIHRWKSDFYKNSCHMWPVPYQALERMSDRSAKLEKKTCYKMFKKYKTKHSNKSNYLKFILKHVKVTHTLFFLPQEPRNFNTALYIVQK